MVAILGRFSQLVRRATADHHGRVLEQIGDGFMIVLSSADGAVGCWLPLARGGGGRHAQPVHHDTRRMTA